MPSYKVKVETEAIAATIIEIDAESEEVAKAQACKEVRERAFVYPWHVSYLSRDEVVMYLTAEVEQNDT